MQNSLFLRLCDRPACKQNGDHQIDLPWHKWFLWISDARAYPFSVRDHTNGWIQWITGMIEMWWWNFPIDRDLGPLRIDFMIDPL